MAASVVLLASSVTVAAGPAPLPNFQQANSYRTWLVRAMDECVTETLSVVSPGGSLPLPSFACPQTNSLTDDSSAGMEWAQLSVSRRGRAGTAYVRIMGAGFNGPAPSIQRRLKVELTLRVTARQKVKPDPPTTQSVTFADTTINCGNDSGGCFVARPNGTLAKVQTLQSCLTLSGEPAGLDSGNIQIVDARLIDCDNADKVIAVPGIRD
jgi:hypothetical protein